MVIDWWKHASWRSICTFCALVCCGCGPAVLTYSATPFQIKVVDADTGLPLEGVIANALWRLETRDGHNLGHFMATEAVSDKDGVVRMPGWGPLQVPKQRGGYYSQGRFDPNQPSLQLYKQDYHFFDTVPSSESAYLNDPSWSGDSVRHAEWDNRVIRLMPFSGTKEVYMNHLVSGQNSSAGGCLWANTPRMWAAFIKEDQRLRQFLSYTRLIKLADIQEYDQGKYCGSKDLIRQYLQP